MNTGDAYSCFEAWRLLEESQDAPDALEALVPLLEPGYSRPRHLKPYVDLLQQAATSSTRVLISVPPRHGKSHTTLSALAWWLYKRPDQLCAYVSSSASLAEKHSLVVRDRCQRLGVRLGETTKKSEWYTAQGGGLIACGVESSALMGRGFYKLVVDDPYGTRKDAESVVTRTAVHDWIKGTAFSRVQRGGSVVVIHQRWHEDDLIGRLSREPGVKWDFVHFPAISEDGQALWPEAWPLEALEERRVEVGEYEWASLYQGQPRPKGGRVFSEPARYDAADVRDARFVIACDPAAGGSRQGDYSAVVVLAVKGGRQDLRADVLEVYREQCVIPDLVRRLMHYQRRWAAPVVVESVGGFKSVVQMLRQMDPGGRYVEAPARGNKHDRAQPVAAAWNVGRLRVPAQAPWLRDFLSEVGQFTGVGDAHDDQVDALAHAWNFAASGAMLSLVRGARDAGWAA